MAISAHDLSGRLIAAVPTPLARTGQLHSGALEGYARWLAERGAGGVAVWAHTGRGLNLASDDRDRVLKAWRKHLAPGSLLLAAAGGPKASTSPHELIEKAYAMACRAAELGAEALLVYPPVAFKHRPDLAALLIRYHSRIAEAGLPLLLFYLYEAAGGISYTPEILVELLARDEVIGIKIATLDSVMTFQDVARLVVTRAPGKLVITGEDRFLAYSLMCGAETALIGMAAACTEIQAELLKAHREGRARGFLALSGLVDDLAQHTFVAPLEGYIQRMLWCLVHQKVIPPEAAHDPWGPQVDPAEFDRIGVCVARLEEARRRLDMGEPP
jgi:4-hydroxy-tetrahydrodipicolinate synthase